MILRTASRWYAPFTAAHRQACQHIDPPAGNITLGSQATQVARASYGKRIEMYKSPYKENTRGWTKRICTFPESQKHTIFWSYWENAVMIKNNGIMVFQVYKEDVHVLNYQRNTDHHCIFYKFLLHEFADGER